MASGENSKRARGRSSLFQKRRRVSFIVPKTTGAADPSLPLFPDLFV